jgi:hypothetical protein
MSTFTDRQAIMQRLIAGVLDTHHIDNARCLATRVVDRVPDGIHRALFIDLMCAEVESAQRVRAHRIEQEARRRDRAGVAKLRERLGTAIDDIVEGRISVDDGSRITTQLEKQIKAAEAENALPIPSDEDEFERLYADPALWRGPAIHADDDDPPEGAIWRADSHRRQRFRSQFRKWCKANRADEGGYDAWLARGRKLFFNEATHADMSDFAWDFLPKEARDDYHNQRICQFVQDYVDQVRFDITAELLGTEFATGDGTKVTWGEATVEQHQERIELLTKMIGGTAETAAMHMHAVEMIEAAGVKKLGDLADDASNGGAA